LPQRVSEAFTLRTYPFQEADLVVSFFTRDQGRLRGVARRARRMKSSFGSGLERLSQVKVFYFQRENRELVRLDSCELIHSQFDLARDFAAGVALDYLAEVSEQLLPPAETNERFFRLLASVLDCLREDPPQGGSPGALWAVVDYFSFWAVRLSGFLPPLEVSAESRELAAEMLRKPVGQIRGGWSRETARDLRRLLVRAMEEHIERRLVTAPQIELL